MNEKTVELMDEETINEEVIKEFKGKVKQAKKLASEAGFDDITIIDKVMFLNDVGFPAIVDTNYFQKKLQVIGKIKIILIEKYIKEVCEELKLCPECGRPLQQNPSMVTSWNDKEGLVVNANFCSKDDCEHNKKLIEKFKETSEYKTIIRDEIKPLLSKYNRKKGSKKE